MMCIMLIVRNKMAIEKILDDKYGQWTRDTFVEEVSFGCCIK